MSLSDRLTELADAGTNIAQVQSAPAGWSPGVVYQSDGSRLVTLPPTPAMADEASWAAAVESLGVSVPDGYRVRLVEAKYDPAAWHRDAEGGDAVTRPIWRYRFLVEVAPTRIDVDDLLKSVKPRKTTPQATEAATFVAAFGDLQLGKPDNDGYSTLVALILIALGLGLVAVSL
jgi:hypothetical protein